MMRASVLLVLAALACTNTPGGQGIGRPDFTPRPAPVRLKISVQRVYAPTPLPSGKTQFVELRNDETEPLDLGQRPLSLYTPRGVVAVPGGVLAAGASVVLTDVAALQLHASAGEVAVIDANLELHGYLAWGNAPAAWSSSLGHVALLAGLSARPVPVPLPLPDTHAVGSDPNTNSCASGDPSTATTPVACPTQAAVPLRISRVQPIGADPNGSWIDIHQGATPIDLYGLQVCRGLGCAPIEYAVDPNGPGVLPGKSGVADGQPDAGRMLLRLGTAVHDAAHELAHRGAPLFGSDEVGLALPGEPNAVPFAYVRMGKPDGTKTLGERLADSVKQAWAAAPLAPPRLAEESLALPDSGSPLQPAAWFLSTGTPREARSSKGSPTPPCSYPADPNAGTGAGLRIVEIVAPLASADTSRAPARIRLRNTTAAALDAATVTLALGAAQHALGSRTVESQKDLWVELQPSPGAACAVATHDCWSDPGAVLSTGEASVLNTAGGGIVQHVQWGASGTPRAQSAGATALVWPDLRCTVGAFADGSTNANNRALRLAVQALGQSPADYYLAPASGL